MRHRLLAAAGYVVGYSVGCAVAGGAAVVFAVAGWARRRGNEAGEAPLVDESEELKPYDRWVLGA